METALTTQRVFKVVFVGDSGVGKSSFIHRFCNNSFNPSFSATIGVDFQVKTIQIKDTVIVLQLWDTAGQERFRSITKQYFRKADGVVVMYDVTSEASFVNVRNWMTSIKVQSNPVRLKYKENVDEKTVIEILGNKTDMAEGDDHRVVRMNDGKKLALEYESLFFECSAKSGINIQESMAAMADLLKDKEDEELEKALHIHDDPVEKKKCCK
ncbi:EF-hand calcium-binding domain-containing protein 4B-like [Argopecten irradians]|uniref:EF-hand calcium-binding domain-containing protein 4B-like n=1 Tax=Argopecten irradians TaxID=31199 RepID=UPI0037148ED6